MTALIALEGVGVRYGREPVLEDVDLAIAELAAFKRGGGGTIVETSVVGLKRDPAFVAYVDHIWKLIEDDVRASVIEEHA